MPAFLLVPPRPKSLHALSLLLGLALLGCSTFSDEPSGNQDKEDGRDLLFESNGYKNNPLVLPLTEPFDMCFFEEENTLPSAGYGVDLNTAKWLAFFSANQYAHYAHIAPVLEQMGFGDEGEGEDWVNQARNVLITRHQEEIGTIPNGGSAVFERDVIQKVVKGKKIQFFAAGAIEVDDEGFEYFNDESTQMLWAEHRTEPIVIITFRGTEPDEYADITADLVAWKENRAGYGSAHTGFQGAYDGVESILRAKLQAESGRGLQIWITGHSLGGALTSLATTTIMDHIKGDTSYSLRGIHTYGMPRVGDDEYVEQVELGYQDNDVRAMRFRNGDDIVTQLPWQWMGFRQSGQLMHLRGEGSFDFDPVEQDPGDTAENAGALADHSIPTYYARIAAFFTAPYQALGNRCSY
ncbi:MAG: lipase family protein [Kofleriaceae bacterium]|nr:lipase family protein [Kofleriaceae bacterium]